MSDGILIILISIFTAFLGEGVTWLLVSKTTLYLENCNEPGATKNFF
jgi:hypothetical protein